LACLGEAINRLARPVDAIRHQAKTVTVGTSRLSDKLEGLLFDSLADHGIRPSQLTARNVHVLKNLQAVIAGITGSSFYRLDGLNLLGEPTDQSTIEVLRKGGTLKTIPSRVETDNRLQGTKNIIVRQGNVYIGKGRKDGLSILIIPILSESPAKPNMIEYLLLLHITFREEVPLEAKVRALGGKHEHIKNIVQETGAPWEEAWLDRVAIEDLFGLSAEKVAEFLLAGRG
jgi:glucosamine--fructose-6-phosphate aminotransferase (isomerizing)